MDAGNQGSVPLTFWDKTGPDGVQYSTGRRFYIKAEGPYRFILYDRAYKASSVHRTLTLAQLRAEDVLRQEAKFTLRRRR